MNKTLRLACILFVLILLFSTLGCGNNANPLVGKWSYEDGSAPATIWDFKADGNLIIKYERTDLEMKYTMVDDDTVRISGIPDEDSSADVDFTINGDTMLMTIVNSGATQAFKRVK